MSASAQRCVWCLAVQVPFLLKGSLREYQHVGLEWLITIYTRRLNGILADEVSRCMLSPPIHGVNMYSNLQLSKCQACAKQAPQQMSCADASSEGCFQDLSSCQCRQPASRCELHILNSIWHDPKCQGIFNVVHLPGGHVALHWLLEVLQTGLGKTSMFFLGGINRTAS